MFRKAELMEHSYIDSLIEEKSNRDSIEVLHGLVERLRLKNLNGVAAELEKLIEGIDRSLQKLEMDNHKFYKQIFIKSKENLDRLASLLEIQIDTTGENLTTVWGAGKTNLLGFGKLSEKKSKAKSKKKKIKKKKRAKIKYLK